jgi:hypothetical protein
MQLGSRLYPGIQTVGRILQPAGLQASPKPALPKRTPFAVFKAARVQLFFTSEIRVILAIGLGLLTLKMRETRKQDE